MTEKEKRENETLKNCIQEAYGLSDEQLLAELEELEATLSDDEFVGAEERIYNKIKEREAERSSDSSEETADTSKASTSNPVPIRKISKKKRWLVIGIAAALVVGAGVNTIGGNSSFLRQRVKEQGFVLNGGQNIVEAGNLQGAYAEVEKCLDIPVLKLNYIPDGMTFNALTIASNYAVFSFYYGNNVIYLIQEQNSKELSLGIASDRMDNGYIVSNEWISKDIFIEENVISEERIEYSALMYTDDANYRIIGVLPKEELENILLRVGF